MPGSVLLDRYEVVQLIAHGGMADVFLARDRRLARDVAVKAFRIGTHDARRFEAETRLLAGLSHPNLVAVLDAGEHDHQPFVVLQHVSGPTLATRLSEGPMSVDGLRRVGADVAAALDYVHHRRIVHRDVKPSNILLAGDGRALLGDFGVALLVDATRLTTDGATIGTAAYLAPEQVTGEDVTAAADVYALGLVLVEAVVGTPSFAGGFQEVLAAKLTRDPELPANLGAPWEALLAAMTAREPGRRPTAGEVGDVLRTGRMPDATAALTLDTPDDGTTVVANSSPTLVMAADEGASRMTRLRRMPPRPLMAAGAAVLLVVLVAIAALVAARSDGEPPATPTTTLVSTATTVRTKAPTTTNRQAICADLERQKEAIERQKQAAEQTHQNDDDKDTLEDIKEQLEEQKRDIEEQKKAAGC